MLRFLAVSHSNLLYQFWCRFCLAVGYLRKSPWGAHTLLLSSKKFYPQPTWCEVQTVFLCLVYKIVVVSAFFHSLHRQAWHCALPIYLGISNWWWHCAGWMPGSESSPSSMVVEISLLVSLMDDRKSGEEAVIAKKNRVCQLTYVEF